MKLLLSIVGLVAGNPTKVDLKFTFFHYKVVLLMLLRILYSSVRKITIVEYGKAAISTMAILVFVSRAIVI